LAPAGNVWLTPMAYPFFTIGHSTRSIAEFMNLLEASRIELVVDVRRIAQSRTNPQFNRDTLLDALATAKIGYVHLVSLGGLRNRPGTTSPNLLWDNPGFRNYADYAMTKEFHEGLTELRDLGHKSRSAIMCAEAVWWRCHRRIIADYLICSGEDVLNILGEDRVDQAILTAGAAPQPDGTILYPMTESSR
jgi:uncharacterized protein (DUF488 family)